MPIREWNPKSFFRHVTPAVLGELRQWAAMEPLPEGESPDGVRFYEAWKALPPSRRDRLELRLTEVNDMNSTNARPGLEALAREQWSPQRLEEMREWTTLDLAVRLFLADPDAFKLTWRSHELDSLEHVKEFHGKHPFDPRGDSGAKERLKAGMLEYFQQTAYGARCKVEDLVNREKFAVFVYHEDEKQAFDEFDAKDNLEAAWRRPVVRLAAIFYQDTLTLAVKARAKRDREQLRKLFAHLVVGDDDYFEDSTRIQKFNFNPLRNPLFDFPTSTLDHVEQVTVSGLVTAGADSDVRQITWSLNDVTTKGIEIVLGNHHLDLKTVAIKSVTLRFTFRGGHHGRSRSVTLTNPNSSNLSDTQRDRMIRRYLKMWGIDASGQRAKLDVPADKAA